MYLRFDLNENSASLCCGWYRRAYAVCIQWIISKMALRWRGQRGDELLKKSLIFFVYKKYSRRIIKFRLNHWWQMDYPDDAFHTFLGIDSVIYLVVNGTVTSLPVFIWNILICVPKTNKAFMGLERHGVKWLMTKFSFWGGVTLWKKVRTEHAWMNNSQFRTIVQKDQLNSFRKQIEFSFHSDFKCNFHTV